MLNFQHIDKLNIGLNDKMCSRYELNGTIEDIELRFDIPTKPKIIKTFNGLAEIRPTDQTPVIKSKNQIAFMHWGLSVNWNRSPIINARSETLGQKPTFQTILQNRCIVPATAYFEWRKDGKLKIKTRIYQKEQKLISFAGIFIGEKFTIITSQSTLSIAHIHNRMPVILNRADESVWLSSDKPFDKIAGLLKTKQNCNLLSQEIQLPDKKPDTQGDLFN